jgi:hypothetical protein
VDGVAWTSSRLEFQRDGNACDVAEIPVTHQLVRVLYGATQSSDAVLRFEGHGVAGELALTDSLRLELRIGLDALVAITR